MKKFALLALVLSLFTACNTSVNSNNKNITSTGNAFTVSFTPKGSMTQTVMGMNEGDVLKIYAKEFGLCQNGCTASDSVKLTITATGAAETFSISGEDWFYTSPQGGACSTSGCTLNNGQTATFHINCKPGCDQMNSYVMITADVSPQ